MVCWRQEVSQPQVVEDFWRLVLCIDNMWPGREVWQKLVSHKVVSTEWCLVLVSVGERWEIG